jgi:hypothetical protein
MRFASIPAVHLAAADGAGVPDLVRSLRLGPLTPLDCEARLEIRARTVTVAVYPGSRALTQLAVNAASVSLSRGDGDLELSVPLPADGSLRIAVVDEAGGSYSAELWLEPEPKPAP